MMRSPPCFNVEMSDEQFRFLPDLALCAKGKMFQFKPCFLYVCWVLNMHFGKQQMGILWISPAHTLHEMCTKLELQNGNAT